MFRIFRMMSLVGRPADSKLPTRVGCSCCPSCLKKCNPTCVGFALSLAHASGYQNDPESKSQSAVRLRSRHSSRTIVTLMNSTSANTLSLAKMIRAGLRHSWKINTSVALGVATATAVIVGALLVGDSMKGSLRALTTERLGKTNTVLAPGAFFSPEGIVPKDINAYPLMLFTTGVGETFDDSNLRRSGSLQIIGCDDNF